MADKLTAAKEITKEFAPFYGAVYCSKKDLKGEYTNNHPIRSNISMAYHGTYMALILAETMIFGLEKLASSLS